MLKKFAILFKIKISNRNYTGETIPLYPISGKMSRFYSQCTANEAF